MAKRLIDANSFVIEELLDRDKTEYLDTFVDGVRATMKAIRTAPTIDAIEVVRCRDCKHWDNPICEVHSEWPDQYNTGHSDCTEPDDFCSYGERKEKKG